MCIVDNWCRYQEFDKKDMVLTVVVDNLYF